MKEFYKKNLDNLMKIGNSYRFKEGEREEEGDEEE